MPNTTKQYLDEELDYLIQRVRKIQRGEDRTVDAHLGPIRGALDRLMDAKRLLNAAIITSPE